MSVPCIDVAGRRKGTLFVFPSCLMHTTSKKLLSSALLWWGEHNFYFLWVGFFALKNYKDFCTRSCMYLQWTSWVQNLSQFGSSMFLPCIKKIPTEFSLLFVTHRWTGLWPLQYEHSSFKNALILQQHTFKCMHSDFCSRNQEISWKQVSGMTGRKAEISRNSLMSRDSRSVTPGN